MPLGGPASENGCAELADVMARSCDDAVSHASFHAKFARLVSVQSPFADCLKCLQDLAPFFSPKNASRTQVTDVDKMHYFDMTRLGAFLAIPLVYQSYYNGDLSAGGSVFGRID